MVIYTNMMKGRNLNHPCKITSEADTTAFGNTDKELESSCLWGYWPLGVEDAIKEGVICRSPFCWWEGIHVLDHIVGQLTASLAQELSFGKCGPASLQGALTSKIILINESRRCHQAQNRTALCWWYNLGSKYAEICRQYTVNICNDTNASSDWDTQRAYLRSKSFILSMLSLSFAPINLFSLSVQIVLWLLGGVMRCA